MFSNVLDPGFKVQLVSKPQAVASVLCEWLPDPSWSTGSAECYDLQPALEWTSQRPAGRTQRDKTNRLLMTLTQTAQEKWMTLNMTSQFKWENRNKLSILLSAIIQIIKTPRIFWPMFNYYVSKATLNSKVGFYSGFQGTQCFRCFAVFWTFAPDL